MALTKLFISNAIFYGYHGVAKAEKYLGGRYQVDIELWYDAESAVTTDDIGYAINYQNVLFEVSDLMQNEHYNLIETLANEILLTIMNKFEQIKKTRIKLRKLNAPVNHYIDFIEVEQTFDREEIGN